MLQTHIGYKIWQEPKTNVMPELKRVAGEARPVVFATAVPPASEAIAVEAPDYTRAVNGKGLSWQAIAHLGRTKGAVLALPQGAPATTEADGVRLEYDVALAKGGDVTAQLYMVPAIDAKAGGGIRLGVSLDGGPVQTLLFNLIPTPGEGTTSDQKLWIEAVKNNVHIVSAKFPAVAAGKHTLKIWRLDDNAVLQKLVLSTGALPQSYLGP